MNRPILLPYQTPDGSSELEDRAITPLVKQAVIMAGGKGTRLHPYSAVFPKP
jgi:hypothetical protein